MLTTASGTIFERKRLEYAVSVEIIKYLSGFFFSFSTVVSRVGPAAIIAAVFVGFFQPAAPVPVRRGVAHWANGFPPDSMCAASRCRIPN